MFVKALPSRRTVTFSLLFIIPIISFILRISDQWSGLYYAALELRDHRYFIAAAYSKGPWYYVQSAYIVLCFLVALGISAFRRSALPPLRRKALNYLLGAAVMPLVSIGLILADPGKLGLDYAPFLAPLSLSCFLLALFRFDFLNVKNLGREMIIDYTSDPMVIMDEERVILDYNAAASALFPFLEKSRSPEAAAVQFRAWPEIVRRLTEPLGSSAKPPALKISDTRFFEIDLFPIMSKDRIVAGYLMRLHDCTAAKQEEERLKRWAATDELTGLPNRRSFLVRAREEFARAERGYGVFSILMIDLDHFKAVNDKFGHAGGDAVLIHVADSLRAAFRLDDCPARIGGEEFIVLLSAAGREAAIIAAEKLRLKIAETAIPYEGKNIALTLSIGVSTYKNGIPNIEAMMKEADSCLYSSKRRGRNTTTALDSNSAPA